MDVDQLNKCVKGYQFLSPRLNVSCFSNNIQKTDCNLTTFTLQPSATLNEADSVHIEPSTKFFSKLFSRWKASCDGETPSATAKMEEAGRNLQQKAAEGHRSSIVSEMEVQEFLAHETGKERLQKMFSKDHMNERSPEVKFMQQVTLQSAAVTFLAMSTLAGRQARNEFIDRNRPTVFKTRFQAFRRLHDAVFLTSMKEGAIWALRVSLFTGAFLGISQSIAAYRNKSSPWEYCIASATTVGLLKANMGLRGFVVACGFGAVTGLLLGLVAVGAMKATNETQEQRHYWQLMKELEKEKLFRNKLSMPKEAGETEVEKLPQAV